MRIRNNGAPELERQGSGTTPLAQDFPDYLEAAHAADALPTVGDLHHAHSPAHWRRMRQQEVIQHVWTSLWPGKVFGGPRLRSVMFHTTAAGYAGQECATLVMFFVQVFTNPDRQREIKHPIAYTLKCLKTAGIQTPYGERARRCSERITAPSPSPSRVAPTSGRRAPPPPPLPAYVSASHPAPTTAQSAP